MSIMKRFKSLSVRIPKVIKEHVASQLSTDLENLPEGAVPSAEYVAIDISGSETAAEVGKIIREAAGQAIAKIELLVSKVREALVEAGKDPSFLDNLPDLNVVADKLAANLKLDEALSSAFREAAFEAYLEAHPEFKEALEAAKKVVTTSTRGLKVDVNF